MSESAGDGPDISKILQHLLKWTKHTFRPSTFHVLKHIPTDGCTVE